MADHLLNIPLEELDEVLARGTIWPRLQQSQLLITGGTGFFGRWIIASILHANEKLDAGIKVTLITRNPEGFINSFPEAADANLEIIEGDIRYSLLPVRNFSHVLHLATDSIANDKAQHAGLIESVVTGTKRVLEHIRHTCPKATLLYASSGAIYGDLKEGEYLIPETLHSAPPPENPASFMSSAKRMAEQLCAVYAAQFQLDVKIARCFSFSGPHSPMQSYFAFGNFLHDAMHNRAITVKGDGTALRGYLYAGDLISWLWAIMEKGQKGGVYNVGSDQYLSMADLAKKTGSLLAPEKPVVILEESGLTPQSKYIPDISKAKRELGVEVWTDLDTSIKRTAQWYTRHGETIIRKRAVKQKTFVMDIDGVLANITENNDYNLATPRQHNINKLNQLYEAGHRIILFTARGYVTGIDWRRHTEAQMQRFGVKYHELHLGKPATDFYVDDKMLSLEMFSLIEE